LTGGVDAGKFEKWTGDRFRKLLVRYEKKARNYQILAELACAVIVWRNLTPVHPGPIPG
jgi:hypothetical protein